MTLHITYFLFENFFIIDVLYINSSMENIVISIYEMRPILQKIYAYVLNGVIDDSQGYVRTVF